MLSKVEELKARKSPLSVIEHINREANGGEAIDEEHIALLKWYGMYPHANKDKSEDKAYYMKRIKLINGRMDRVALNILSDIALKYAKGFVDFTTRQNVQFHYIQIKDLPNIFKAFENTALTSRFASGDAPRPIVNCPVSGLDKDEIYDVNPIIKGLDKFFDENEKEFSNLPRKYKIGISGCKCHCMGHEIQDIAFTAFKDGENVLFDLTIGGGLSKSKRIASRANRYIKPSQVQDVAVAGALLFRDFGNRDNRSKARVRHLLEEWGIEKFVEKLEEKLDFDLIVGDKEPEITPYAKREHFGVHKSNTEGEYYIGCATNRGRVSGVQFKELSDLINKFDAKGIALTTSQNFVIYGVKEQILEEFKNELKEIGFDSNPSRFAARTQSCTGLKFCKFAITETKDFTNSLISHLEKRFPDFNKHISLAVSGCPNGCSHPHIADIGLIGTKIKTDMGRVEGYEIYLGGTLHGEKSSKFGQKSGDKIPATEIFEYVENLIEKKFIN